MKHRNVFRASLVAAAALSLAVVATPQLDDILRGGIKVLGVGALVDRFGPDINKGINRLVDHDNRNNAFTKVVPILTIGINQRRAVGAAQVMGARSQVEQVKAVAQVSGQVFGEIEIRALVPVSSTNIGKPSDIRRVDGVGVSGIVDLRL